MKKGKKLTGGRYRKQKKKKLHEIPGQEVLVKLGDEKKKSLRVRGGNKKTRLLKTKFVNISEKGKTKKLEIKNVLETPSNKFLARQDILIKRAIVETPQGKVKITNRPSQENVVNGILIKE